MKPRWPVVFITGPTASGKSALAMALAEELPVEIISADSAQVYRQMDIGTAKPSASEQAAVAHHLIDICDPAEAFSTAAFVDAARACIADIRARGRLPLVVGGTNLYLRSLEYGISDLPSADTALREEISAQAAEFGWPAMHARLEALDADRAAQLHPNDSQRIQRALEIVISTGEPVAAWYARGGGQGLTEPPLKFAVMPVSREAMREQIALRFRQMMDAGLLDEVRVLHQRGDLHRELPSIRSVGYRQLWAYLEGELDLDTAITRAITATRQFAKRQLTWLNTERDLTRLKNDDPTRLKAVRNFILQQGLQDV